jgi:hypothetical protein
MRVTDRSLEGRMKREWWPVARSAFCLLLLGCSVEQNQSSAPPAESAMESSEESAGAGPEAMPVDKLDGEEGRWRRYRTHRLDPDLSEAQREQLRELESIGYLDGSQVSALEAGARSRHPSQVQPGVNLYTSGHLAEARLIDNSGELLHSWSADFWQIWPDYPVEKDHRMTQFWRRVRLLPDGGLLAIYEGLGLLCLNADSSLRWAVSNRAHHDLDIAPDGRIYVLTREAGILPRVHPTEPILEDFISVLDPDSGEELRRVSILEAVETSDFDLLKEGSRGRSGDLYHTNALWILDGQSAIPTANQGQVLLYLLGLGTITVLDMDTELITWASTGPETHRHDPRPLDNGRVLIFNNFHESPESTVTELDPRTGEVHWRYQGSEQEPFYSKTCGTAQRLENGNTLITESDNGRAFEVNPQGEIVWEFVSPHRAGPDEAYIATLFELSRLTGSELGWLSRDGEAGSAD